MKNVKVKRKKCYVDILKDILNPKSVFYDKCLSSFHIILIEKMIKGNWICGQLYEYESNGGLCIDLYIDGEEYNPERFIIKEVSDEEV